MNTEIETKHHDLYEDILEMIEEKNHSYILDKDYVTRLDTALKKLSLEELQDELQDELVEEATQCGNSVALIILKKNGFDVSYTHLSESLDSTIDYARNDCNTVVDYYFSISEILELNDIKLFFDNEKELKEWRYEQKENLISEIIQSVIDLLEEENEPRLKLFRKFLECLESEEKEEDIEIAKSYYDDLLLSAAKAGKHNALDDFLHSFNFEPSYSFIKQLRQYGKEYEFSDEEKYGNYLKSLAVLFNLDNIMKIVTEDNCEIVMEQFRKYRFFSDFFSELVEIKKSGIKINI